MARRTDALQQLGLSPGDVALRDELRAWLAEHLVGEFLEFGGRGAAASDEGFDVRARWEQELARGGWLGLAFPERYGGRATGVGGQIVFAYEYARAGAPYRLSIQGIWTTFGHHADWIYVLCRTNADAPRHRGLSVLLVPMRQPGIEVRPIRNLAGGSEFCEVFFNGARTDADLVVGDVDDGWRVALTVLAYERATATLPHQMQFEREVDELFAAARQRRTVSDPTVRQRLIQAWIGVRILGFNNARTLTALVQSGTPGPEASIAKIYWSDWHRDLCEIAVDVLGADAMLFEYGREEPDPFPHRFLLSRAETIYGGTNQIQRNTVGERVLGLPREPRP